MKKFIVKGALSLLLSLGIVVGAVGAVNANSLATIQNECAPISTPAEKPDFPSVWWV